MLHEQLDKLQDKVLYYDTDSIIYADSGSQTIGTGDMLGDLTDELDGQLIKKFVSTGPKSYSFIYGENKHQSKIKGFSLNHENGNLINHENMTRLIKKQMREIIIVNE